MLDRWNSDAFESSDVANQIQNDLKKKLLVNPHPISGWRSIPLQNLKTVKINEFGLRSKNNQILFNQNLIFGGSYAWGFGASSNNYIPSYLLNNMFKEKINKDTEFINCSEQMYSSYEEMLSIVDFYETNPKSCILISGINDIAREYNHQNKITELGLRWINYFRFGQTNGIVQDTSKLKIILKFIKNLFSNKKDAKYIDYEYLKIKKDLIASTLLSNKLKIIENLFNKNQTKIFYFFQPSIYFKKNKSRYEQNYIRLIGTDREKFDKEKIDQQIKIVKKFAEESKNNFFFFDLSDIYNDYHESIFFDKVHVTDKGYKILSEKIFEIIKKDID